MIIMERWRDINSCSKPVSVSVLIDMSSQDSGISVVSSNIPFSPISSGDYDRDVDSMLEMYENAAKAEKHHLLSTSFPVSGFELKVGLSPARIFSPAIVILPYMTPNKISFGVWYKRYYIKARDNKKLL